MLGKSHGQRALVGYSPWGRTELDTTEAPCTAHPFVGLMLEAETPILWPPDAKSIRKDLTLEKTLMLGKIEGRRRRGR